MDELKSWQKKPEKKEEESPRRKRKKKNSFVEFLQLYSKYIIMALVLILVVVAVILVVGRLGRNGENGDPTVINVDPSGQESQGTSLEANTNSQVNELVAAYFTAVSDCDVEALSKLIYSAEEISEEQLQAEREYVEGYENINCYTVDGLIEGTYIVYVSYDMKFLNVETPAPSLIRLYICTNDEGGMYIYNEDVGTDNEVASYMEEVNAREDVQALRTEVDRRLTEAMAGDEDLNSLVRRLYGEDPAESSESSSETAETSSEASESSEAPETTGTVDDSSFTEVDETVYATENVRVRRTPSADGEVVGTLAGGQSVHRTGYNDNWSRVEFNGETCYIAAGYLTENGPESQAEGDSSFTSVDETVYATQNVNIRSTPEEGGEAVGRLAGGQSIRRTGYNDSWSRVEYNGETCYIASEYLTTNEP